MKWTMASVQLHHVPDLIPGQIPDMPVTGQAYFRKDDQLRPGVFRPMGAPPDLFQDR